MAKRVVGPPLTAEQLRAVLHYDPKHGFFIWKHRPELRATTNSLRVGTHAGSPNGKRGYIAICINGKLHYAHRLAWLFMTGEWPNDMIDHIDGDTANNKFANLRQANRSQNNWNAQKTNRNTSGYKGVYWSKNAKKWVAHITIKGVYHYLGLHNTAEAGHAAYCEASARLHGEYSRPS